MLRKKLPWICCRVLATTLLLANCAWAAAHLKVVHSFAGGADGIGPTGSLVFDQSGNLYGTTSGGGTYGFGTVFELMPFGQRWTKKVLYNFSGGTDGAIPESGVIFDNAGNLYGTVVGGSCGAVFQLTPGLGGGWTESILHSFSGSPELIMLDSFSNCVQQGCFGAST